MSAGAAAIQGSTTLGALKCGNLLVLGQGTFTGAEPGIKPEEAAARIQNKNCTHPESPHDAQ